MEMDSLFFGAAENAFFSFDNIDSARKIKIPIYPFPYYALLNDSKIKPLPKTNGEIRLIGMDVATQGGAKNDATCFTILQMIPTSDGQYIRNLVYLENMDGGHTLDQAIRCRQLFSDFECDYIIIDTNGVGVGVFDNLVIDQIDDQRNVTYSALSCINDEKMAERCKSSDAQKVIYSIKANQQFNSDCAVLLRDYLKRGKVRLLCNESEGNELLNKIKQFQILSVDEQLLFQAPYYQTTALVNEMVNLGYEVVNGKIKLVETAGMRKDRYSSASYANYIASEIERGLRQFESDYEYATFIN